MLQRPVMIISQHLVRGWEASKQTYHGQSLAGVDVAEGQVPEGAGAAAEGEDQREERAEEDDVGSQGAHGEDCRHHSEGKIVEP